MKQNIHILWINDNPNFKGGAENYIYRCVKHLNKMNIKSSILFNTAPWTDPRWTETFSESYPLVDVKKQLDSLQPDIIYLHNWPGGKILDELLKSGRPIVRFIHDSQIFATKEYHLAMYGHKTCYTPGDYKFYHPLLKAAQQFYFWLKYKKELLNIGNLNRKQSLRCHKIIVASKYLKKHLLVHGAKDNQTTVNPLFFKKPKHVKNIIKKQNQIIFVGQLVRGKGLDLLLHAISKISSLKPNLIVCGDGAQKVDFEKLVKYLKIDHQVTFKGQVTQNDLSMYYQESECLVIPSRVPETFCLTGIEGMAHKIPIITTSLGGMTEWQTDKNCLTFEENNVQSLTLALEKILSDKVLAKQLSENAYADYLKKFQPEMHIEKLLEIFNDLVEESKVSHA